MQKATFMANILPKEKQCIVIGALAEGNSIRSVERLSGIHRDTIMRLGVRVGEGCQRIMDERMRNLNCRLLQVDEVWGFIGMKQKTAVSNRRKRGVGDVWTWVALDSETKLVPTFAVGDRSGYMANAFIEDVCEKIDALINISKRVDAVDNMS